MNKKMSAALLILPLSATAFAGFAIKPASAATYFEGDIGSGAIVKERNSSVEVRKEVLTFSVSTLSSDPNNMDCAALVEAEYTFYNPSEQDEEMTLLLPVGQMSSYFGYATEKSAFTVRCGGEHVSPELRYTFGGFNSSELENVAQLISDEYREDDFFTPEMPVSCITYRYTRTDQRDRDFFHLILKCNPARTRVVFGGSPKISLENGRMHAFWQSNTLSGAFQVYSVGDPAEVAEISVSADAAGKYPSDGTKFFSADEEKTTFAEFVESYRTEEICETDWYNGIVDLFREKSKHGVVYLSCDRLDKEWFRPWYKYKVQVPAGGTALNAVTTSLVPSVDTRGPVYSFNYLLSPLARWKEFGEIEINIRTPFHLYDSSLEFEKCDFGYTLTRSELPLGELQITLAEHEGIRIRGNENNDLSPSTKIAIGLLSFLGGTIISGAAMVIVFTARRKKSRK